MATIKVVIQTVRQSDGRMARYEFTWEGDAKQAASTIEYVKELSERNGETPFRVARGVVYMLPDILEQQPDLPERLKAAVMWWVLHMPVPPDGAQTVLQRLAFDDFIATLEAVHAGEGKGTCKTTVEPCGHNVVAMPRAPTPH
jgi:hypothetical protein